MSDQPLAPASDAPLQFDRVVHADPSAARPICSHCSQPLTDAYFHERAQTLCATCGTARQQSSAPDRSLRTLVRAGLFGTGAAIVGGIAYWGVMEFLQLEIGIVAIAIGWLVGRAIARATHGRSARRHQATGVALTYLSVALAYAPFAIKEWKGDAATKATADSTSTHRRSDATVAPGGTAAHDGTTADSGSGVSARGESRSAVTTPAKEEVTAGGFVVALLAVVGFLLALPVIASVSSMPAGLLSLLIIGLGLRQAWRISAAANTVVTGPHALAGTDAGA